MRGQPYGHLFADDDEAPKPTKKEEAGTQDLERALADAKAVGNNLFQEGRYDDACAAYKQGIDLFEGSGGHQRHRHISAEVRKLAMGLYCNSAQCLLKCTGTRSVCAGRSRAMAEKALALEPMDVKALFRRGCAYSFAEDWARAVQDFNTVLELEPGSDAARRELEKAQEQRHGPGPVPALATTSLLLNKQEQLEDVIADAEDAKAKGTRLFKEGGYYAAYEAWQKAISALSEFPREELTAEAQRLMVALFNNSAQALLQCPEVDGASTEMAADMANRALELEPSNIKALFRRGSAYANSEKWYLARRDFQHILELEPGHTAAQEELAKIKDSGVPEDQDADGAKADMSNPEVVARMAQREADRFRREILAHADGHGGVPKWCQRFNKLQVQAAAWAKHQLSDPEVLEDLVTLRGPVFALMSEQQKEDFIAACEFMSEMRTQHGDEIDELLGRGR
mmetsp:Transcript_107612/g.321832  ORF Transcript_107612/g.321832 Transcript_107612/m.321832 type:complete len:455 (-) Transcript_107612:25-1389(-)